MTTLIGYRWKRGDARSRVVLIAREFLSRVVFVVNVSVLLSVLIPVCKNEIDGGYGGGVTPLPISNREVKPSSADGTGFARESRSPPL